MHKTKTLLAGIASALVLTIVPVQSAFAYSEGTVLKQGLRNSHISELQQDLKDLGFMSIEPTGYFGNITKNAVVKFQKRYGLKPDGIAGNQTIGKINSLFRRTAIATASRGGSSRNKTANSSEIQLLPWFGKVDSIYKIGDVATVTDVGTGLKMQIKRTFGTNHADVETLTADDTATLKKAAGGSWNWTRRPVIVEIHGYRIAGSLTAMPHAGRDDKPALTNVSGRSGGYGYGENLDAVKNNGMDGQFDIHFYGSKTHATNKVDEAHQAAIQKAYKSGL
jgi:peptidoglycan hydrolase-like protein with peptidoglycan-binding domain